MSNIKYGFEDKPSLGEAIPLSLQHVIASFAGLMSGAMMLAAGWGLGIEDTTFLIQCALFVCGISTMLQALGFMNAGAKLPIVSAGSFTFIATMIQLGNDPNIGKAGAFGGAIIGSIVLYLFGPFIIKHLHKYFSSVVTGSVVLAVGVSLMTGSFEHAVDFDPTGEKAPLLFGIAALSLIIILLLNQFTKGIVQSNSITIAIVIGYIVSVALGLVNFESVGAAKMFAFPRPLKWGFKFSPAAILTVSIVHMVTLMEGIGNTTGIINTVEGRLPTDEELMRQSRGDGLGGVIAGLFNGLPVVSGGSNIGIIVMTGVASRFVVALSGLIFVILAFLPKVSSILALTPNPVLGGALAMIFGSIAASGINIISMNKLTNRDIMILGLAISLGLGGHFAADYLTFVHPTILMLFTGIPGTAIISLVLNIILPRGKDDQLEE